MKRVTALFFSCAAMSALADRGDTPINTASELRDWCRNESEAALIGRGLRPSNWSASYSDAGNVLFAKGQWRSDGLTYKVECSIARGARSQYGSMSIQEPPAN